METVGTIDISCEDKIYSVQVDFGGQNQVALADSAALVDTETTDAPLPVFFSVTPLSLDFGTLTEWNTAISQSIQIQNHGNKDLKVTLQSVKWLNVVEELIIPAAQTVEVKVSLKQLKLFDRPKGSVSEYNGVVISASGQSIPVRVDMQIK
jgi:hypothetical protein